jgi:hypothetical protein
MRNLLSALLATFFLIGVPSFSADEAKCTCDHKCSQECKEGKENKSCDCKACDCAKTGKCSHDQCGGHEEKKAAPKK